MKKKRPAPASTVKNYSSRREWKEKAFKNILKSGDLLRALLTDYERDNLTMRAAVLEGLESGKGQRQLSRELSVSLQTVNSVKKAIAGNAYKSYSERSKKERKRKKYDSSAPLTTGRGGKPVRTKYGVLRIPQ